MREIKLRVWDNFRKKFAKQITTFKFDRCGNINLVVYLDRANKTKEITEQEKIYTNDFKLMQYTGLKDKNGRDIYEGDIISIKADYLSEFNSESILPCEIVAFEDGAFGTYDKKRTLFVSFKEMIDKSDGIEFEIIGNVFENPELLESAK